MHNIVGLKQLVLSPLGEMEGALLGAPYSTPNCNNVTM